jgi:hypothetical protein
MGITIRSLEGYGKGVYPGEKCEPRLESLLQTARRFGGDKKGDIEG